MSDTASLSTYSDHEVESSSLDENEQFFQTDYYSESAEEDSYERGEQRRQKEKKTVDPGFHIIKRVIYSKTDKNVKKRKMVKVNKIVCYSTSSVPGRLIRNAVTGMRTNHRVGYADEDLYFSTVLATGELGQTPKVFFYDNPEQYEYHLNTTLSNEQKLNWSKKYTIALESKSVHDTKTNELRLA